MQEHSRRLQPEKATDPQRRIVDRQRPDPVSNGGAPFDAVVIGAGMYGAYCAEKVYGFGKATGRRVLLLEAGPFLVSEHVQNLARIGLNVPAAIPPSADPGTVEPAASCIPTGGR